MISASEVDRIIRENFCHPAEYHVIRARGDGKGAFIGRVGVDSFWEQEAKFLAEIKGINWVHLVRANFANAPAKKVVLFY